MGRRSTLPGRAWLRQRGLRRLLAWRFGWLAQREQPGFRRSIRLGWKCAHLTSRWIPRSGRSRCCSYDTCRWTVLDVVLSDDCGLNLEAIIDRAIGRATRGLSRQSRNVPLAEGQERAIPQMGIVLHHVQPSRLPFGAKTGGVDGTSTRCRNRSPARRECRRCSAIQSGKGDISTLPRHRDTGA